MNTQRLCLATASATARCVAVSATYTGCILGVAAESGSRRRIRPHLAGLLPQAEAPALLTKIVNSGNQNRARYQYGLRQAASGPSASTPAKKEFAGSGGQVLAGRFRSAATSVDVADKRGQCAGSAFSIGHLTRSRSVLVSLDKKGWRGILILPGKYPGVGKM